MNHPADVHSVLRDVDAAPLPVDVLDKVQSGIGIGYSSASGGGFGYQYALGANVFALTAGGTATITQTFAGATVGFGYSVTYLAVEQVATKASVDPIATAGNPLASKKIVAIGDSMVQGHTLTLAQVWLALIAARNGGGYINYGINGTFLSDRDYGTNKGAVIRYPAMDDTADYVLVFAGTNDAANAVTLGSATSTNPAEFNGALNTLIAGLLTKYPSKKLGFITPYRRNANYPAYVDAIKARCAEHAVPVFDNVEKGGIDWTNAAQVAALTLNDTYHLGVEGMKFASTKYEHFLRSL